MADGSLHFTLFEDGTPVEELAEIMKALRERKRYFRLKDGAFLDLSGQEEWEELAETLSDADELHSAAADRAASAVQLDTLFVDEGFGSLSGNYLDLVMDELNDTANAGRRLIGIISHVDEIKEGVERRIEVAKAADGSSRAVIR